jgi:hypothetical protein
MNFRPKKGKVIWSLIIVILFWLFLVFLSSGINVKSSIILNFFNMHNLLNIFVSANIILFIIEFVVLYLLFSLFQRKNLPLPSTSSLKR